MQISILSRGVVKSHSERNETDSLKASTHIHTTRPLTVIPALEKFLPVAKNDMLVYFLTPFKIALICIKKSKMIRKALLSGQNSGI